MKAKRIVFLVVCFMFFVSGTAFMGKAAAMQAPEVVTISDNFGEGTPLFDMNMADWQNVTSDQNGGNADYGLIPAPVWGARVSPGDGYIEYYIQADGDKVFSALTVRFNTYYGCAGLVEYYGSDKTNINVYIGAGRDKYTKVFDAHNGANYSTYANVVDKDGNTLYGNQSKIVTVSLDLSDFLRKDTGLYIKIEFIHMTYDEIADAVQAERDKTLPQLLGDEVNESDKIIALSRLGIRFRSLEISAVQQNTENIPDGEIQGTVHNGSTSFDFGDFNAGGNEWEETSYQFNGLYIRENVDYHIDGKSVKTNALCSKYTNNAGFITYKYVAESGKTFAAARSMSFARLFDYYLKLQYEKLEYYISYDNKTFIKIHSSLIKMSGSNCVVTELDLDAYVFGRDEFYFKVVIGCSNDVTWTNLKSIKMDITFATVGVSIDFGGGNIQSFDSFKGQPLDISQINPPAGFISADDKLYTDAEFESEFDINTVLTETTTLYAKGSLNTYSIFYNLNGGINHTGNASVYSSAEGLALQNPHREGYSFIGWFTDQACKELIRDVSAGKTGDLTLYAKWAENTPPAIEIKEGEGSGGCSGKIIPAAAIYMFALVSGLSLICFCIMKRQRKGEKL